jgi:lipopolysaccharide/colanic/teichoic acid biosynthesis glycosyltransferase
MTQANADCGSDLMRVRLSPMSDSAHTTAALPPAAVRSLLKRGFDVLLAVVMLLISSPAWAAITLLISIDDGRPVFFAQDRWGLGAKHIRVLKFRTMAKDAVDVHGVRLAQEEDARVTRNGRVLRRMGLDELPNLLSILGGEMSFVGPRALAVDEAVREIDGRFHSYEQVPGFRERLRVRPGLTGLATVYLPRDASPRRKFAYDLLYIRRWSFGLDLKLVVLSFFISVLGRWERRTRKV